MFYNPAVDHAVAGMTAGLVTTLTLHPLDLIKTRLQVKQHQRANLGMTSIARHIIRHHGWRGLYQGLSPNALGSTLSWGLYFLWYTAIKQHHASASSNTAIPNSGTHSDLSMSAHLVAAAQAGALTALMTHPIWLVKTRMCIQDPSHVKESYSGIRDALTRIYRNEGGLRGWYKGLLPSLVGVSHGAVQFMVYEELKKWYATSHLDQEVREKMPTWAYLMMAATSKTVATFTTYPYQVIRSRLQDHRTGMQHETTTAKVMKAVFRQDGFRGFFRGLLPNVLRVLPGTCITFVVYETLMQWMREADKNTEVILQQHDDESE